MKFPKETEWINELDREFLKETKTTEAVCPRHGKVNVSWIPSTANTKNDGYFCLLCIAEMFDRLEVCRVEIWAVNHLGERKKIEL